jgi:hypothetical protein
MKRVSIAPFALSLVASAVLSACGGGGGGGGGSGSSALAVSAQNALSGIAGQTVVLNGYAQTAGQSIASASWQQTSGPTAQLTDADCAKATSSTVTAPGASSAAAAKVNYTCPLSVTLPVGGASQQYGFRFTVTDATGNQQSATATVNAAPAQGQALSVVAGPNANLYPGQTYKGSCQATGGVYSAGQAPTYQWSISGPAGVTPPALAASGASVSLVAPTPAASQSFQLTCQVADSLGASATGLANLTVYGTSALPPLVVNAGDAQVVSTATPVTLTAAAQTASGQTTAPVYYFWKQTGGSPVTLANVNTAHASFVSPGNPPASTSTASTPAPSILTTLTFTVYASYQPIDPSNLSAIPAAQQGQTTVEVTQQ